MKPLNWSLAHTGVVAVLSVMFTLVSLPFGTLGYWLAALCIGTFLPPIFIDPMKVGHSLKHLILIMLVSLVLAAVAVCTLSPSLFLADLSALRRFCLTFALGWLFFFLGLGLSFLLLLTSRFARKPKTR